MHKKNPKICTGCSRVSAAKIYLYHSTEIAKARPHSPNISTTPITAKGCQQCLPLSVVQLTGKPHCRNGVVDMFRQKPMYVLGI